MLICNSCVIIIINCAVTTSVTLESRLESQNRFFWSWNLWTQLHWLIPRSSLQLLSSLKIIISLFFFYNLKSWVLWELLGLLKEQTRQLRDAQGSSQYCTRTTWKVSAFIYIKCQQETTESVPYITYPVGLLAWFTPIIGKQALFSTGFFYSLLNACRLTYISGSWSRNKKSSLVSCVSISNGQLHYYKY